MTARQPFIIVATGLEFEARIARKDRSTRVCCGRGPEMIAALNAAVQPGCRGILSFGIAGGLDPSLQTGNQLVASSIVTENGSISTDDNWARFLLRAHPRAIHAPIFSTEDAVVDPNDKNERFQSTGAVAVDMESHIAADVAAKRGLPVAVLRVVADPATRRIPQAAMKGMRPDGSTNVLAVLHALVRRPGEIAGLFHVARNAWTARMILLESQHRISRNFVSPDASTLNASAERRH
jgi:adenosylhomocysteine nucleosidase